MDAEGKRFLRPTLAIERKWQAKTIETEKASPYYVTGKISIQGLTRLDTHDKAVLILRPGESRGHFY